MKFFLMLFMITFSLNTQANCGKVSKFLLGGISDILTSSYSLSTGDGRCGENGRLSLVDLMEPDIFLRSDYHEIVRKTFLEIENDESWNMEAITLRNIKKYAPSEYEMMKSYLVKNIGSLASLNKYEKEVVRENPAGALWVMYNGKKAQYLETLYSKSMAEKSKTFQRENAGYLGKGDAFRHITWNALSARYGFEDIAAKFIDAHERKDESDKGGGGLAFSGAEVKFEGDKTLPPIQVSGFNIHHHLAQLALSIANKDKDFNVKQDTSMDEYNNELGRSLGQELYCTFDDNEVFNRVSQVIENGEARIVDNCMGRKHKLIKSNKKFEKCDSEIISAKIQCDDLVKRISLETSIEELEKLALESKSTYQIGCAYNKLLLNNILEKYKADPKIVSINKSILKTKEDEAKKNDGKNLFEKKSSYTIVTEEEKRFLCSKFFSEYKKMNLNESSCSAILKVAGVVDKEDSDGKEFQGGIGTLEAKPPSKMLREDILEEKPMLGK